MARSRNTPAKVDDRTPQAEGTERRRVAQSALYRSAPVDAAGPDFINAVAELRTGLSPQELLHALQAQDRRALHTAKQALLRSAYRRPATAPLRRALRDLSWWMAAMLLPLRR